MPGKKLRTTLFLAILAAALVPAAATSKAGEQLVVSARANIFGAGHATPPAPGGGGAGVRPPVVLLPRDARVVLFPSVTGRTNCCVGYSNTTYGPVGEWLPEADVRTDVRSYGGISGIVHEDRGMFLAGVFLGDAKPKSPAPPRRSFTDRKPFRVLSPELGQTFLIGDGKGRRYRVPRGATRLFLGFADAYAYVGRPGWYGNNAGRLTVTVRVRRGKEQNS